MDKLRIKEKSKSPTLFKVPNTPRGQIWDFCWSFWGHLEVKMHFFKALCSSMDKLPNKDKSNLNHYTQRSILGLEVPKAQTNMQPY